MNIKFVQEEKNGFLWLLTDHSTDRIAWTLTD